MKEHKKKNKGMRSYIDDLRLLQYVSSKSSLDILHNINPIKSNTLHATNLEYDVIIKNIPHKYDSKKLYKVVYPKTETVMPNFNDIKRNFPMSLGCSYQNKAVLRFTMEKSTLLNLCQMTGKKYGHKLHFVCNNNNVFLYSSNIKQLVYHNINMTFPMVSENFRISISPQIEYLLNKHRKNKIVDVVIYKVFVGYRLAFELYEEDIIIQLYDQKFEYIEGKKMQKLIDFVDDISNERIIYSKVNRKMMKNAIKHIYRKNKNGKCRFEENSEEIIIKTDESIFIPNEEYSLSSNHLLFSNILIVDGYIESSNNYVFFESKQLNNLMSKPMLGEDIYIGFTNDGLMIIKS